MSIFLRPIVLLPNNPKKFHPKWFHKTLNTPQSNIVILSVVLHSDDSLQK